MPKLRLHYIHMALVFVALGEILLSGRQSWADMIALSQSNSISLNPANQKWRATEQQREPNQELHFLSETACSLTYLATSNWIYIYNNVLFRCNFR